MTLLRYVLVSMKSHAFASVHCCLVVTCRERTDLLPLFGDVYCIFVTFPCGILSQLWYLIVRLLMFGVFLTLKSATWLDVLANQMC